MIAHLLIAAALLASGCESFINKRAASSTYAILKQSNIVARREADLQLARDATPGGLMQLEAFSLAYPDHSGFKQLHAEAFCSYAVAFIFDDWEDASLADRTAEADALATRLRPLLARCAALNRALLPRAWRDKPIAELPPLAKKAHAPALLWLATTDAVSLALAPMANFTKLPDIRAALTRCAELAPGAHNADAELLLATLEAGTGAVFGTSDGHAAFDRARSASGPGALLVDVMFARGTAVARKDRALFTSTLEAAVAADVSQWPERRLANELARKKARRYLAAIDKLVAAVR
ncbi:MAG: TRAP transporter TatT component family protein [Polyangiales bacterium]